MFRLPLSSRALPRIVVMAVSTALVPLPAAATTPATPSTPVQPTAAASEKVKPERPLRAAIEKVDARELQPTSLRTAARRSAQVTEPSKESPAFFKSGTGILVLAVIGAGVGYALYSASNDRIHSPGKE